MTCIEEGNCNIQSIRGRQNRHDLGYVAMRNTSIINGLIITMGHELQTFSTAQKAMINKRKEQQDDGSLKIREAIVTTDH